MALAGASAVELVAFGTVGLLGGVHCLGMCGPLVRVTAVDGLRAGAGVVVGLFVVATGQGYALRGSAGGHPDLPVAGEAFGRLYGAVTARVDDWVEGPRIAALGTVHAALPCPITS